MVQDLPERFGEATRTWFAGAFRAPTAAQTGAWDAIGRGNHALVVAPTGSGKTLAAFLAALDQLLSEPAPGDRTRRCRVVYISPLKALATDIQRNLRSPLAGISHAATGLGQWVPEVRVGVRTGDTPASERRSFATKPPDIFITTPESLFLVLTSQARGGLAGVQTVIVDEVHALAGSKRGSHLALSLERLDELLDVPAQRVALSATVRPVEEVARFVGGARPVDDGGRPVEIVQPPSHKTIDVRVRLPVPDLTDLGGGEVDLTGDAFGPERVASIWPYVHDAVVDEIASHASTLVFANSRQGAERLTARINEEWTQRVEARAARSEPDGAGRLDQGHGDRAESDGEERENLGGPDTGHTARAARSGRAGAMPPHAWDSTYGGLHGMAMPTGVGDAPIAATDPEVLARAHHGSMSRTQRTVIEEELKAGTLPAVVATSSLELGIDMGAIDLVIQVGSPPSVASGLQRVGRAGHQVGAVSRGLIYPTYRGDLVPAAVTAARMREGTIEALRVPANPLDVLAQQIVAAVAMDTWTVPDLARVVRRAAPYAGLGDRTLEAVLDMLAGRYPSADFGELRPRILWDRETGELTPRPGAARLAVVSGGTIPDRGQYTVFLAGSEEHGTKRVGELDEEMVYESRVGDTFTLGSSTWRIVDITPNAVMVLPAPGLPGRLPFWRGDGPGRPAELGEAIGRFVRKLAPHLDGATDSAPPTLEALTGIGLDAWSQDNMLAYLRDQREAAGVLPDDRTIVVERFTDELGDWRVAIHSPWGARVNGPWAAVLSARLRERYGLDAQVMHSDDGLMLRLPETAEEDVAGAVDPLIDPDQVRELVTSSLSGSAHFAARFREAAARALLLPRRRPDKRQPLWQQRHRASQLLQVAAEYSDFPIIHEAVRECLQDDYDVPALTDLMRAVAERRVRVVEVTTPTASPFASALAFGYTAQFLYDGDAPLAERRAAALSLDPAMLAELLGGAGQSELADLLDPDVVLAVDAELARRTPDRPVRGPEDLADLLRALGPQSADQLLALPWAGAPRDREKAADGGPLPTLSLTTGSASELVDLGATSSPSAGGTDAPDLPELSPPDSPVPGWADTLVAGRRAIKVRIGGVEQWAGIEDAGMLRDGLGIPLPTGIPAQFTEATSDPLGALTRRFARTHGPFTAGQVAQTFGLGIVVAGRELDQMVTAGRLTSGHLRPAAAGGTGQTDYCDPDILTRLRRRSLAVLRRHVEPVEQRVLGSFATRWHQFGALRGSDGVLQAVSQLAGAAVPASAIESLILPARVRDYAPAMLDELITAGEITWVGAGRAGGARAVDGSIRLIPAGTDDALLAEAGPIDAPVDAALLDILRDGGGFLAADLRERLLARGIDTGELDEFREALWRLAWGGWITADSFAPVRATLSGGKTAHRATRHRATRPLMGRRVLTAAAWRAGGRDAIGRSEAATPPPHGTLRASPRGHDRPGRPGASDPRVLGRWFASPIPAAQGLEVRPEQLRAAQVAALMERHGILTRGSAATEASFAAIYPVLTALEESGAVRRGYFIERLGGSQFALPPCPDMLRSRAEAADAVLLAAADPANPYGAALPWPEHTASHRPGRTAGALVVLIGGDLILYLERGGHTALSFGDGTHLSQAAQTLADGMAAGRLDSLKVTRVDGIDALAAHATLHPLAEALLDAGFTLTPSGLRLRRAR
ncbi:MAG: DEAD/DEAH box helicase [Bifidobacteriaceae bacterium]|nr:DEAD/DEAH box helicase [Bifidobacteriaceae bacterium]